MTRNALALQGVVFPRFDLGFELYWSSGSAHLLLPVMPAAVAFPPYGGRLGGERRVRELRRRMGVVALTEFPVESVPMIAREAGYLGGAVVKKLITKRPIAANDSRQVLFDGDRLDRLLPPAQIVGGCRASSPRTSPIISAVSQGIVSC